MGGWCRLQRQTQLEVSRREDQIGRLLNTLERMRQKESVLLQVGPPPLGSSLPLASLHELLTAWLMGWRCFVGRTCGT